MTRRASEVGGGVIGGHVFAAHIHRLPGARPDAPGLAVAGMLAGSPGTEMEDRLVPCATRFLPVEG